MKTRAKIARGTGYAPNPQNVVVISGASSGMGRDAALHLCELGYTVIAGVRKEADAESLNQEAPAPNRLFPVIFDVTSDSQIASLVEEVERRTDLGQRIVGVFSNAGIASYSGDLSSEGLPLATLERVMNVNFIGAVRFVQALLPYVRMCQGTIVFNSALMAHTVLPFNGGYAPSKTALEAYADALRMELRQHGTRVAIIEAAAISTLLEAKQDTSQIPNDGPYPGQRRTTDAMLHMKEARSADPKCDPRNVSQLVAAAIASPKPKPRAIVGGGSKLIYAVGLLPTGVRDRLITTMFSRLATQAAVTDPHVRRPHHQHG